MPSEAPREDPHTVRKVQESGKVKGGLKDCSEVSRQAEVGEVGSFGG